MSSLIQQLESLATDDFQNRGGNYPKADIPDAIYTEKHDNRFYVNALFKNTDEDTAKSWIKNYLTKLGFGSEIKKVVSSQDGDYHNDWVYGTALFEFKEEDQ